VHILLICFTNFVCTSCPIDVQLLSCYNLHKPKIIMRFGLNLKISKIVTNLQEKCEEEKFHMFWDTSNMEKKN
jgi:hypothetical protein